MWNINGVRVSVSLKVVECQKAQFEHFQWNFTSSFECPRSLGFGFSFWMHTLGFFLFFLLWTFFFFFFDGYIWFLQRLFYSLTWVELAKIMKPIFLPTLLLSCKKSTFTTSNVSNAFTCWLYYWRLTLMTTIVDNYSHLTLMITLVNTTSGANKLNSTNTRMYLNTQKVEFKSHHPLVVLQFLSKKKPNSDSQPTLNTNFGKYHIQWPFSIVNQHWTLTLTTNFCMIY